ncbi:STAS domain-containing protein [Saccharothrix sp. MB29]|nr:STAS domain-containing protein [Saccharothrix sp. MB29]
MNSTWTPRRACATCCSAPPPVLVLDLTAVRSSLVRSVAAAGGQPARAVRGWGAGARGRRRVVLRPLEITGVVRVLTLFPTLAEALTWKSAARVGQPA